MLSDFGSTQLIGADTDQRASLVTALAAGITGVDVQRPAIAIDTHRAYTCFDSGAEAALAARDILFTTLPPIPKTDTLAQMGRCEEAFALAGSLEKEMGALGASDDAPNVIWNVSNVQIHFRQESRALAGEHWHKTLDCFDTQRYHILAAREASSGRGMRRTVAFLSSNVGFLQFMGGRRTRALQPCTWARASLEALGLPCEAEKGSLIVRLWRAATSPARVCMDADRRHTGLKYPCHTVEAAECRLWQVYGDDARVAFLPNKMRFHEGLEESSKSLTLTERFEADPLNGAAPSAVQRERQDLLGRLDRTGRDTLGLASRAEVEELAHRLRYQWNKFGPVQMEPGYADKIAASTDSLLVSLYELLLEPLESELSAPRLTIIPHGMLHSIPFHALRMRDGYVLDRWEVAYAPSAAVWRFCRQRPETQGARSLVFGYSDPDIAYVSEEVAALIGLLPEAEVYEDDRAILDNVPTEGSYRYLHFATHAIFRKDNPLFSGLKLSDGWLIAHDLYNRRLDCSRALLSACRTERSAALPVTEANSVRLHEDNYACIADPSPPTSSPSLKVVPGSLGDLRRADTGTVVRQELRTCAGGRKTRESFASYPLLALSSSKPELVVRGAA